jgi:hypothetical protein
MPQSTWAAKSNTWSADSYVWYNTTYADSVNLNSDVSTSSAGNTIYPASLTFDANTTANITGGFSFVGSVTLGLGAGVSSSANTIYVSSITLSSTEVLNGVGNKVFVDSIAFGSTVDFPLPGMSDGWDEKTTTWASDTTSWGYIPNLASAVTANMTQTILSELHEEDATKLATAILALESGTTASATVAMSSSISLANTQNIKNNINFEENITLASAGLITSDNNLLWNDTTEDTSTTWTKVADPDE